MPRVVSILAILLVLLAGTTLAAEGQKNERTLKSATVTKAEGRDLISVNRLLGNTVENRQGENLGEINNLIVDPRNGRIAYVLLNTGTFFGGDTHLVPFKALQVTQDRVFLDMDRNKLAQAPRWESGQTVEELDRRSAEFFGVGPYWVE